MIKKIGLLIATLIICFCSNEVCFAQKTDTLVNKHLEIIEMDGVNTKVKRILSDSENEILNGLDFKDMVLKVINGEFKLSFKEVTTYVFKIVFKEVGTMFSLIKKLVLIAVLSALLKNINSSFKGHAVGELSFYVCYMVLIFIIASSFSTGVDIVLNATAKMVEFIQAMIPVFLGLMLSGGDYGEVAIIGPIVMSTAEIMSNIIKTVVIPAITFVTMLEMINHISERSILNQFTMLMKSIISWGLKITAIIFMTVVSLGKLGTPGISKVFGKTAKAAVGAVPVVGDVMEGAVEAAAALTGMVKNSVAAVAIIFLIIIALIPLLKLCAMIFMYKITAAAIEPVCEDRIVKCISAAGDFSVLLIGSLFTVEVMFIFSVIIMLSTA